jgi:hypothetical protein
MDIGKRTYEVAIVWANGKVTMSNGRTTVEGRQKLYQELTAQAKVALEAWSLSFIMAKEKGISKKKAIVAIARRLAELLHALMRTGSGQGEKEF